MPQYYNERLRNLRIGINSYTDNELVLDVIGNVSIGGSVYDTRGSVGGYPKILTSFDDGIVWQDYDCFGFPVGDYGDFSIVEIDDAFGYCINCIAFDCLDEPLGKLCTIDFGTI
tara:strand:- start:244 stop:585 length:342 start_codon:yes stop_codon:yes gene_type:complete